MHFSQDSLPSTEQFWCYSSKNISKLTNSLVRLLRPIIGEILLGGQIQSLIAYVVLRLKAKVKEFFFKSQAQFFMPFESSQERLHTNFIVARKMYIGVHHPWLHISATDCKWLPIIRIALVLASGGFWPKDGILFNGDWKQLLQYPTSDVWCRPSKKIWFY